MPSGIFYKIINSVSSGVSWASFYNQMPSDGHYKDLELRHRLDFSDLTLCLFFIYRS